MANRTHPLRRNAAFVALAFGVLALVLSSFAASQAAMQRAVRGQAALAIRELGYLGGLRDEGGAVTQRPLTLEVVQQGGPLWVREQLEAAVEADAAFRNGGGPHLLRVEVVAERTAVAIQPQLFRAGWGLKLADPLRTRQLPWLAIGSACLGALAAGWILLRLGAGQKRLGWGLFVAGGSAQLAEAAVPWPASIPVVQGSSWWTQVRIGPLGEQVARWARELSEQSVYLGVGIVVVCLVLVAFDHHKSRKRGGVVLVSGLAGVLGMLLWVEAGARTGLFAWGATLSGVAALAAMVGLWGCVFWHLRTWRLETRSAP